MQRHWYIYKKDHHLGPFTLQNLRELFQRNSISLDAHIWRDGDPGWKPLKDYDHLVDVLKLDDEQFLAAAELWSRGEWKSPVEESSAEEPPELPPLPVADEQEQGGIDEFGPPDLPLPDSEESTGEFKVVDLIATERGQELTEDENSIAENVTVEVDDVGEDETDEEVDSASDIDEDLLGYEDISFGTPWYKKLLLFMIVLVLLVSPVVGLYFYTKDMGVKQLPFEAESYLVPKLFNIIRAPKRSVLMQVTMDRSGKKMWLTSNLHYPAQVELVFSSLEKKILSTKKVVFRAKVKLDKHFGQITKVVYDQGNKIIPGHYRVTLKGRRTGLLAQVLNTIYSQSWSRYIRVFYEPHLIFYATTVSFIGHGTPETFQKRLKKFFQKEREKKIAPYKLWIQKFRTLSYTLGQFKVLIKDHISSYRRRSDLQKYEQDYSSYIGGLIQNVVVEEQKNMRRAKKDNLFFFYQKKFLSLAIKSSKLGGKVVTALEKRKRRFHKRWKKAFISYFDEKITTLQDEVDKYSAELEELLTKALKSSS